MHVMARAMGMCLLADSVPAEQAAQWGLIWQAVDDDQLDSRAAACVHMWTHA